MGRDGISIELVTLVLGFKNILAVHEALNVAHSLCLGPFTMELSALWVFIVKQVSI